MTIERAVDNAIASTEMEGFTITDVQRVMAERREFSLHCLLEMPVMILIFHPYFRSLDDWQYSGGRRSYGYPYQIF
ncbi:antitoxin VbhA family protein [Ruminococcus bicirculans (ex Wegman et al. 2014)]|uniref:antitoxin VbhA family protein n=1 Tax=Ruminococcus bicirculans (ex Wegman et al. 2014) TaxID=1160721 RepID=UPI003995DB79